MSQLTTEQIVERIHACLGTRRSKSRLTFTIEIGRGETYSSRDWTLYGHDTYERSSVLAGRPRRTYIWDFGPGEAGLKAATDACKQAGIWKRTEVFGGSSHIPVNVMVAHLPDDDDY